MNEKVKIKIQELRDAIKEAGGSVMLIGELPAEKGGETLAILQGREFGLAMSAARIMTRDEGKPVHNIFQIAMAAQEIVKRVSPGKDDHVEVTEKKEPEE